MDAEKSMLTKLKQGLSFSLFYFITICYFQPWDSQFFQLPLQCVMLGFLTRGYLEGKKIEKWAGLVGRV